MRPPSRLRLPSCPDRLLQACLGHRTLHVTASHCSG